MMDAISRMERGLQGLFGDVEGVRQEQIAALAIRFYDSIAVTFRDRPARRRVPTSRPSDGLRTAAEAAAKLRCSIKTFKGHVAAGRLKYVPVGHGTKRLRKMFTDADLNEFIANQTRKAEPCPSTVSRARHSGTSTSSGTVIDFTGPRKPPTDDKRKR